MVRTTNSPRLVQGAHEVTGVWVAVVKGVGMARAVHFRRGVQAVCRQDPRCICRREEGSWCAPGCRGQGRTARTCGNAQVREASLSHRAGPREEEGKTSERGVCPTHLCPVEESRNLMQNRAGCLGAGLA